VTPTSDSPSPARQAGLTHDRLPIPGTVLSRKYRGRRVDVKVLPSGFEYEGQVYRSLSAVANRRNRELSSRQGHRSRRVGARTGRL